MRVRVNAFVTDRIHTIETKIERVNLRVLFQGAFFTQLMYFGHSFTQQQHYGGLKTQTFENRGLFFVPRLINLRWFERRYSNHDNWSLANLVHQTNLWISLKYLDKAVWDYCAFSYSLKRADVSILKTTISNAAIGWWQDSNILTSYN